MFDGIVLSVFDRLGKIRFIFISDAIFSNPALPNHLLPLLLLAILRS